MSLITEDGTGLATAESYISVADADIYHANHGNTLWDPMTTTLTNAEKEQALRRATGFMIGKYRLKWLGRRVLITQALDWPRVGVVLEDFGGSQGRNGMGSYGLFQVSFQIVPTEVKEACAELALRATMGSLVEDLSQRVLEETIGPITVKYDNSSPQVIRYVQIDEMIRVYLAAGGNTAMMKLSRC